MNQFTRLNTKSVADSVSEQIQHLILGGGLKPSEKLPAERVLASEFNVSRMSLRQGIALLVDIGLLVVRKDGTYVCDVISPSLVEPFDHLFSWYHKSLNDMLNLQYLLQREAIKLAIERSCETDTNVIHFFYQRLLESFDKESKAEIPAAIHDFHMSIIDCSYNLAIATVLRGILSLLNNSYQRQTHVIPLDEFKAIQVQLYQAIIDKDNDSIDSILTKHIDVLKSLNTKNKKNTSSTETDSFTIDSAIARIEHLLICGHYEASKAMPSTDIIANDINEKTDIVETSLQTMQKRGLLTYRRNKFYTKENNAQSLINDPLVYLMNTDKRVAYDVLELRIILEKNSAAQAATNTNKKKHKHLKKCLEKLISTDDEYNPQSNALDDYEFHLSIADMADNMATSYLMRGLFNLLRASISNWLALFNEEIGDISIIREQHITIYESIVSNQSEDASEAMRAHLQYVITTMRSIYQQKERETYSLQRWRYLDNKFQISKQKK